MLHEAVAELQGVTRRGDAARSCRRADRRVRPRGVHRRRGAQDRPPPPHRARRERGRPARAADLDRGPLRAAAGAGREPLRDPGGEAQARRARRRLPRLPRRSRDGRSGRPRLGRAARVARARRDRCLLVRQPRGDVARRGFRRGARVGRCYAGRASSGLSALFPMHPHRHPMKLILLSLLVLALAACGGGGGGKSACAKLAASDVAVVGSTHIPQPFFNSLMSLAEAEREAAGPDVPEAGHDRTTRRVKSEAVTALVQAYERQEKAATLGHHGHRQAGSGRSSTRSSSRTSPAARRSTRPR